MGFFSSVMGGSNPTLPGAITQAGKTAGWTSSLGQNLTTQAGNLYSSLLGGDPAATAKLLAPQMSTLQQQGQQAKQTMSQFGNRSGGITAKGQTLDDTTRSNINNMISTLTGQAAGAAGSMGQSLVDTGMNALNQQVNFSQQQMQNWQNSILGQGMGMGAGMLEGAGLMKLPFVSSAMKSMSPTINFG